MSKPPITFRLTDQEHEVLEKNRQPQESISQCAARLLREKLDIVDNDGATRLEVQTLDSWITEKVNSQTENVKAYLQDSVYNFVDLRVNNARDELSNRLDDVNALVGKLVHRIEELEKAKPKTLTRTRKTSSTKTEE